MSDPILVVGPGSIGGVLAARWAESGREVSMLCRRPADEAAIIRGGLSFTGTGGRQRLVRRGLQSARRGHPSPAAAAFLCVKSQDVAAAARAARPWIGPETVVVCLQNGLRHAAAVRRAFGPGRTVVGVCYFAAERRDRAHVAHNGGKDIHLARFSGNETSLRKAAALLRAAGWKVTLEESEDAMLWTKLCFNAAGNPLGAACAATNGDLVRDPALKRLLGAALDEAVAAASRAGHRIDASRMRRLIMRAYPLDSRQRNSMLQDLQAGRPTEVDAIVGPIVEAGRRSRVATPVLSRLASYVRKLEKMG